MSDLVGQQLGTYRLLRLLGVGSFATVYLGEPVNSGASVNSSLQVAIKVFHTPIGSQEAELLRQDEALLTRLKHPNLVRVFAFGLQETSAFLVMAYVEGGTLRQHHPPGSRLELPLVATYLQQLAWALDYLHRHQLVHGNLKPENILLEQGDQVLLGDFSTPLVAQRLRSEGSPEATRTRTYLAPESIQGRLDPASDQYALAILVYEWLTGAPPFAGSVDELSAQHLFATPASLRQVLPSVPAAVEQVVLTALAKEPRQRFASVLDFATVFLSAAQLPAQTPPLVEVDEPASPPRPTRVDSEAGASPAATAAASKGEESPPAAGPVPMWKVPSTLTSLVGREQEVAEITGLLMQPEMRLLTLLGPGGIGKTRLSIQVATQMRDYFVDGICFVGLAAISDPHLVIPTIAQELGVKESGARSLLEQVQTFVGKRSFLLVLDNFEQVVAAASEVEQLLTACPHLKILVTSRAVLHLSAEQVIPVAPLALPDLAKGPTTEDIAQSAAVTLFVQRARSQLPSFQLTPANAQAIAEVCVRLDGLPLAIELAAARVRLLSPQALLAHLAHRLQVLTGGPRSLPARQQTLRNALKWSYDLLGSDEQALFRLLAVFVGGWQLSAAEALAQETGKANLDILNTLSALLDSSLIQQSEQEGEQPRFRMLLMVREYGLELLDASGEQETTQALHARYFLSLVEQAQQELDGPKQAAWLERLDQEHDNLRAALDWALLEEKVEQASGRRELALRLSAALERFWEVRGYYSEARTLLERALAQSEGESASLRVRVLPAAAYIAILVGDHERAGVLARQSLALSRELNDTRGIARSLFVLGRLAWTVGKTAEAISLSEEMVKLVRQTGEPGEVAEALYHFGYELSTHGEYARGQAMFEEALALFRKAGNELWAGITLIQSAIWLFVNLGDGTTIRQRLQEGQALVNKVGNPLGIAMASYGAAALAWSEGEVARAASLAQEAVAIYRKIDSKWFIALTLQLLGYIEFFQGDLTAARHSYQESLTLGRELDAKYIIALDLEALAILVARQQARKWAAQLWGTAEVLREVTAMPILPSIRAIIEWAVSEARTQLGEEAFTAAWQEGRAMKLEQVIDDVLKWDDEAGDIAS